MTDERKQQIKRDIQAKYHWSVPDAEEEVQPRGKAPAEVLAAIEAHAERILNDIPDMFDLTPEEMGKRETPSWAREVVCITNSKRFKRVNDAAKWACVSPSGIVKACTRGNYVDGLRFMYADASIEPPVAKYIGSGRRSKPVECLTDTGKTRQFDNVRDAANIFGLSEKDIWNAIRKQQRSGGMRWRWIKAA